MLTLFLLQPTLLSELQALAKDVGHLLESEKFANAMDAHDELKQFRSEFVYPKMKVTEASTVIQRITRSDSEKF